MSVYFFVYIVSAIFSFCYSKTKDKSASIVFLIMTFLSLFLPLALRYEIGTDYENYRRIIYNSFAKNKFDEFEIGWVPLLKFIYNFNLDIQWFFVISAFFSVLFIFLAVGKRDFWLAIPCYVSIAYIESFSLVRQALAVSICMFVIKLWTNRKYLKSFIFLTIAFLFHKSTILFVFFLPFLNRKWKIFSSYKNIVLFLIIYVCFSFFDIANIIMTKIVGNTFYANYITSTYNKKTEGGTGLSILCREIVLFCAVVFSSRTPKKHIRMSFYKNGFTYNHNYQLVCILSFSLLIFYILSLQIHIFNRLPNLLSPFFLFLVPTVYNSKTRYRKIIPFFMIAVLFFVFIFIVKNSLSSLPGGLGITPYRSIFNK